MTHYALVNLSDFDDCAVAPCVHGYCTDYVEAYACTCDDGYEGTDCDAGMTMTMTMTIFYLT